MKVDDDILTIKADDGDFTKSSKKDFHYIVAVSSLALPDDIHDDGITAVYKDEILHVLLPKSADPVRTRKRISIQ